jgi:hypothetical protein
VTLDQAVSTRCNIGPDEIASRRRAALLWTIATVITASVLLAGTEPGAGRLLIWPLTSAAAITWLQVVHRFCVAFGALGLQNFGGLGRQVPVAPSERAADRRRALQLIVEGALIGLVVALALAALPWTPA